MTRAAGGQRGRHLVRHEVQRKVEWRNSQHRTDGEALHNAPAALVAFGQVQRDAIAAEPRSLFGSGFEGEHGAIDLSSREADRLARFGDDELGEALLLLDEGSGHVFEDFAALPARQGAGAAQAGHGVVHGLTGVGAGGYGRRGPPAPGPTANGLRGLRLRSIPCRTAEIPFVFPAAFSWRCSP